MSGTSIGKRSRRIFLATPTQHFKKCIICDSDPALQEVHYTRLKIHEPTKGLSDHEFVKFIRIR